MSAGFYVVVPARHASNRLPGKPLEDIAGRPMISWVCERALASGATEVCVATDDERIAAACHDTGASVEMTSADHESGTDRIAEVAARRRWTGDAIVVNLQGDEPLMPPRLVAQVAEVLRDDPEASVSTLVTPLESEEEWRDPNVVRVVLDRAQRALYFSRAQIPWPRDGDVRDAVRHVGLYAYRVSALLELASTPPCDLEQIEKLEQLRALWLGMKIAVATAAEVPPRGVDTQADLERARATLRGN